MEHDVIKKLEQENSELKQRLESLINQNGIKDEIVIQQSKMASMGEMINNIAHQWRQPLMEISSLLMNTEAKIKLQGVTSQEEILDTIDKSNQVIKFMSHTIDDFRNFFATNKQKEEFLIAKQISSMLNIMKISLSSHNIKVDVIIKNNLKVTGFKNEYAQVLVNIISNAKDAIVSNNIKNGKIIIKLYAKDNKSVLEIEDNAGGIPFEPKQKVFDPFFTYKKKNGTGIGLFMSKIIIETNMNGKLDVTNKNNGACFSIVL
jgi:C4-dicarboxylate-specific signal transduction histidine kinase